MIFDFLGSICSQPIHEVNIEQLGNQVLTLRGNHAFFIANFGPFDFEVGDIVYDLLD